MYSYVMYDGPPVATNGVITSKDSGGGYEGDQVPLITGGGLFSLGRGRLGNDDVPRGSG